MFDFLKPRREPPSPSTTPVEMTVQELKTRIDGDNPPVILDVRRPEEFLFANIGGILIALDELPNRLTELEPYRHEEIVVICRSGGRSAQATAFLVSSGFGRAINLHGGILAWSREIDGSVPTY